MTALLHVARRGGDVHVAGPPRMEVGVRRPTPAGIDAGLFAGWSWDGEALNAYTDPLGFHPLFYSELSDGIAVSPSLIQLLEAGVNRSLDYQALAVFCRLGFFIGDSTPFRSIRQLPAGGRLLWHDGRLQVRGERPMPRTATLTRDEAIDGYISLFHDAIRQTKPASEPFAVPLSGGRDSRHILLALHHIGHLPQECITVRQPPGYWAAPNKDAALATVIAEAVGVSCHILDAGDRWVEAERRKNLLTHLCADEHNWFMPLREYIDGRWPRIYDGIAGDVLSAGLFLTPQRHALAEAGRFRDLAELLCREGFLVSLLRRGARRSMDRETAVEAVAAEIANHADAPNPVGSFFFWNRTRREIALSPCSILGTVARVETPYLAPPLVAFLSSLPAAMLMDGQFHTDTIARAYPAFAHLPYEIKGARTVDVNRYVRGVGIDLLRYCVRGSASPLLSRSALMLRILRLLVNDRYVPAIGGIGPAAVYLRQLGAYSP